MKIFFFTVFAAFFLSAFGGVAASSESCEPYSKGEFGPAACSPLPTCGDKEMLSGRVCVCVDGYQRNAATRMCELPPCDDGQERVDGVCPPPLPTCGDKEMLSGRQCVCVAGYERNTNGDCQLPPPAGGCRINQEWNGENCVCVDGYEPVSYAGQRCILITDSSLDDEEYRRKFFLREMGATYAYDRGYFGQGVTVANLETVLASHNELTANVVTMSVDYAWRWDRFMKNTLLVLTGFSITITRVSITQDGIEFITSVRAEPTLRLGFHGTNTGAIIVGERNGVGSHGVAPEAKLIPLPFYRDMRFNYHLPPSAPDRDYSDVEWILDNDIPIVNGSLIPAGFRSDPVNSSIYARIAASDTVFVWSRGNNPAPGFLDAERQTDTHFSAPRHWPGTEDNWLFVTALSGGLIDSDVTPCAFTMNYCLAAAVFGGTDLPSGPDNDDTSAPFFGTSASAPIVSGALAVLKSAVPMMPMTVVRQILLTTAMDMGAPGIDELYGWGVVNIHRGIQHIENLKTENGILLRDLRRGLPSEFSHLRGRLSDVSVALKITDDSYWNMPLTAVLTNAISQASLANAGVSETAAKEIMAAEYAPGESFRFWGGVDIDANGASQFIGEGGGAFGAESAEDKTGFIKWTTADYNGVSGFGEFVYTDIDAEYGGEGLVSKVDGAFGEEWKAGLEWRDVFRFGDRARFSVRQQKRIGGGEMILEYPVADGDSHTAFIGETPQTIRMETARIPLKEKRVLIYGVGYSSEIPAFAGKAWGFGRSGGEWSAAAEWNSQTNAAAFWAGMELEF